MKNKIILGISLLVIPVYGGSSSPRDLATLCLNRYISYFFKTLFDTVVYIVAYDIGKHIAYEVEETIKEVRLEADYDDSGSEDSGT